MTWESQSSKSRGYKIKINTASVMNIRNKMHCYYRATNTTQYLLFTVIVRLSGDEQIERCAPTFNTNGW